MLNKLLAFASVLFVLLFAILGYWYLANPESWNRQFFSGIAEVSIGTALAPAPPTSQPIVPPAPPIRTSSVPIPISITIGQTTTAPPQAIASGPNAVSEPDDIASICSLPATTEVTRSPGSQLYSWRDENGRLTISDRPPASGTAARTTRISEGELEYFTLDIEYPRGRTAFDIETPLRSQVNSTYRIFTSLLGFDALRKVHLDIVLHTDKETYHRAASTATGRNMTAFNGHYSSRDNQAVTYLHADNEATMVTVRHESVHVITTGILGLTPPWLSEGLAEYFEHISVSGNSSQVSMDPRQLRTAQAQRRSGSQIRLRDFLNIQRNSWRGPNMERNYAMAWSLVYFLMENPTRRQSFAALLQEVAQNFCQSIDTSARLHSVYPGGLPALEREFFAWLDTGRPQAAHNY